jgi:hypothetical protein
MLAPKTPVDTVPPSSVKAAANALTNGSATGPGAAALQLGLRPFAVSA